jgi:hypothetical protein
LRQLEATSAAQRRRESAALQHQQAAFMKRLATLQSDKLRLDAEVAALRQALTAAQQQRAVELASAAQLEAAAALKQLSQDLGSHHDGVRVSVMDAIRQAPRPPPPNASDDFPSEAAKAVSGQVTFPGIRWLGRPPDTISVSSGRDGVASFNFKRGESGRSVRIRLPLSATVSEAIAWMLGNVLPVRTDLLGNITGWYRISLNGTVFPAHQQLGSLNAQ